MPKSKLRKENQIMIYGYGRVSTKGQAKDGNSLEAQERLLKEHGAEVIYMDSFTGTKMTRPEFDKLLEELKAVLTSQRIYLALQIYCHSRVRQG